MINGEFRKIQKSEAVCITGSSTYNRGKASDLFYITESQSKSFHIKESVSSESFYIKVNSESL